MARPNERFCSWVLPNHWFWSTLCWCFCKCGTAWTRTSVQHETLQTFPPGAWTEAQCNRACLQFFCGLCHEGNSCVTVWCIRQTITKRVKVFSDYLRWREQQECRNTNSTGTAARCMPGRVYDTSETLSGKHRRQCTKDLSVQRTLRHLVGLNSLK